MADFTDLTTGDVIKYDTMKDEHEIVLIDEKTVTIGDVGKIVAGEINSQEIEFQVPRYYDNVDLLTKTPYFLYKTPGGVFKDKAIDISYNDEFIRFNWLMNEDATMYAGVITGVATFEGKDEKDKNYIFKSMEFTLPIMPSIFEYDADGVYHSWSTDIDNRLTAMEATIAKDIAFFIGTDAEYDAAVAAGDVPTGIRVIKIPTT